MSIETYHELLRSTFGIDTSSDKFQRALTAENQVAVLIAAGCRPREIAEMLGITEMHVWVHLRRIAQ
jgi:DNA-binding NarL/FixJ family response regulator